MHTRLIKREFWHHLARTNPGAFARRRYNKRGRLATQNDQHCTIRYEFVCFIDNLARCKEISDETARSITL